MSTSLIIGAYLIASVLFILGLKGLTHPRTAVRGNLLGALGMLLAVVVTLLDQRIVDWKVVMAGLVIGSAFGADSNAPVLGMSQVDSYNRALDIRGGRFSRLGSGFASSGLFSIPGRNANHSFTVRAFDHFPSCAIRGVYHFLATSTTNFDRHYSAPHSAVTNAIHLGVSTKSDLI